METIYYVYVLRNMARKHYIGVTENLQHRLTQRSLHLDKVSRPLKNG